MQDKASEEKSIEQLAEKAVECHQLSLKKAQVFARQAKALQKNLELRRKQQAQLNKKQP